MMGNHAVLTKRFMNTKVDGVAYISVEVYGCLTLGGRWKFIK
jgi:hypothetical protein